MTSPKKSGGAPYAIIGGAVGGAVLLLLVLLVLIYVMRSRSRSRSHNGKHDFDAPDDKDDFDAPRASVASPGPVAASATQQHADAPVISPTAEPVTAPVVANLASADATAAPVASPVVVAPLAVAAATHGTADEAQFATLDGDADCGADADEGEKKKKKKKRKHKHQGGEASEAGLIDEANPTAPDSVGLGDVAFL